MIDPIQQWLDSPSRDFAAGAQLYDAHGRSEVYKRLFALGATSYSRDVLLRELRALVATAVPGPAPVPVPAAPPVARQLPAPLAPAAPTAHNPLLQQLQAQLKAARDERSQLHAQLTAPGVRVATRRKMVHRICQLTDQVQQLQENECHVLEHGRLPGPVPLGDITDRETLLLRRNNLRSQRSRLQRRPERAADLAQVVADLALIEQKLNPTS